MNDTTQGNTPKRGKTTDILILKEIFNKPRKRTRNKEDFREGSLSSIILRVLLICLVIDGGIYLYFHFVKKVSVSEGVRQLRESVFQSTTNYNTDKHAQQPQAVQLANQPVPPPIKASRPYVEPANLSDRTISKTTASPPSTPTQSQSRPEPGGDLCSAYKVCNVKQTSIEGKVFSWKDKDGKHHFSNTNFPLDNETLKVEAEINSNTFYSVTKFAVSNNQILVPVTLFHKGKSIKSHMVLDTGCSQTAIPYYLLDKLNVKYTGDVISILADGTIINGKRTIIDTLTVGPKRVANIPITGLKISGSMNMGLLGLNFLKENPFHIDFDKQMIIWM